jgi:hypothetical protein
MSPSLELWGAVVKRLKQTAGVTALVGSRVYDHIPRGAGGAITATFPFVAWASVDSLTEDADCFPSEEITFDIDCWSQQPGAAEVQKIAAAVKAALHDNDSITLTTNKLALLQHRQTRVFRDPDGITSHAVLTFEAVVETA